MYELFDTEPYHLVFHILLGMYHLFVLMTIIFYMVASCTEPGYTKKIQTDQFAGNISKAIQEGRNIDYFCFTCRSIWGPDIRHCPICQRCVENHDHHCQVIDNCIGRKNHCYFIGFLVTATLYGLVLVLCSSFLFVSFLKCGFGQEMMEEQSVCYQI